MKQFIWPLFIVILPLRHLSLTSAFGYRIHPLTGDHAWHAGVDLKADHDTVFAVMDGHITSAGNDPLLGTFLRITSGPFCFTYGHLNEAFTIKGNSVAAAMPIGISGATGRVTGPHLHFAVQFSGRYIDPLEFFEAALKEFLTNKRRSYEPDVQVAAGTDQRPDD